VIGLTVVLKYLVLFNSQSSSRMIAQLAYFKEACGDMHFYAQ